MKGLILKDLYTVWRTMRPLVIIIPLILIAGMIMTYNIMPIENTTFIMPIEVFAILSVNLSTTAFMCDKKCGWLRYALTTPITRREYFHAKLLVHTIFCVGGVLVGTLFAIISTLIMGRFSAEMLLQALKWCIPALLFGWLVGVQLCALMIRFNYYKAIMLWAAYAFGILILTGISSFLLQDLLDQLYPTVYFRSMYILMSCCSVCTTIGTIVFYRLGVKWMERKGGYKS